MSVIFKLKSPPPVADINVTPMVDVMLVLLIIFMVITPMLQNKVQITMATVENPTNMPDADKEDAIVVAVTRDGAVYLGPNKVDPSELGSLVRDKLQDKTDKMIFFTKKPIPEVRSSQLYSSLFNSFSSHSHCSFLCKVYC